LYAADYALWLQYAQAKEVDNASRLLPKMEADATASNEALKKIYEQDAANAKKVHDEEVADVSGFLDTILVKHQSFSDALKTIYDKILKNFLDMVSNQIVGSRGFQSAFGNLGGSLAAGGQSGGIGGLFGGLTGAASSASQAPTGTSSSPVHVVLADSSPTQLAKMTGNSAGISSNSLTAAYNSSTSASLATAVTDSAGSALDATGANNFGFGSGNYGSGDPANAGATSGSSGSISLESLLSGAATGGALSSLVSGLSQGQNDSGVGGTVGGIVGTLLHANPLIGAGIDLVSSLFGGLFGSHETPAQQPDISQPVVAGVSYGQFIADIQGTSVQAGGNTYNPTNAYNTSLGGTNESGTIMSQLKSVLAPNSGSSSGLLADAKILQGLANGDTASNALNIIDEKQGVFTLQSGAKISVTQFMQDVQQFTAAAGTGGGSIPTFAISRDFNPNLSTLASTGQTPAVGTPLGTTGVVVNVQGNVIGQAGIQQLATTISQAVYAQQNGTLPGTGRSTQLTRSGGGY
jgi:hypothetical protein